MLLKSTTRHIRIFAGKIENNELVPDEKLLTLDIDPDNELNWNDTAVKQVYQKFDELVAACSGEELTEYNLGRIVSDLEHFVRALLQSGEISYNLGGRVNNYSLGLPRVDVEAEVK